MPLVIRLITFVTSLSFLKSRRDSREICASFEDYSIHRSQSRNSKTDIFFGARPVPIKSLCKRRHEPNEKANERLKAEPHKLTVHTDHATPENTL